MHILIDVRTSSLSDIHSLMYAEAWADLWQAYHPHDVLTFLAFEGDPVERHECIFLSRSFTLFPKKLSTHAYGPDRIVSFSKYPSLDASLPMLLHVEEVTETLYPKKSTFFSHHRHEYRYKKHLKNAHHIILPHHEIGDNLGELYGIDEEKMSIIPYLTHDDPYEFRGRTILPYGICDDYFITEGTSGDEWNPTGLISAYAEYIFTHHGSHKLIIVGDLGENLSKISSMILHLGLTERVKIVGILTQEERGILYSHAKGWIYMGHYYSRGSSVALAHSYKIPLYLSSIAGLKDYDGCIHIHPNHIDSLPGLLADSMLDFRPKMNTPNNEHIMQVYTRLLCD